MTRQTILVIGAGGFIGRRIIEQLSTTTWACPVAAGRNIASANFSPQIETVTLDATNPPEVERALRRPDAVISCIAGHPRDIVTSGRLLLETAAKRPTPPKVVLLSSMAAYGSASGTLDEQAALLGDQGPYSAAKAQIDTLAAGLPFVTRLRPGIVYGPGSAWWSDRIARLLMHRRLGDMGKDANGICNLVHVSDVASSAIQCLRTDCTLGEAFNLGSPLPPTWNAYFAQYAEALRVAPVPHISATRLALELRLLGPLLKLGEKLPVASHYFAEYPAIRPWLVSLCHHRIRLDVRKAQELLGIRWLPLGIGLEQTAAWFLAGGRSP